MSNAAAGSTAVQPYYQARGVTIYHGDALDVLPTLHDDSVGLVVTDPPYVLSALSAGNLSSKTGTWADMMNNATWFTTWLRHAARVLRDDGALWTFLSWRTSPAMLRAAHDAAIPATSMLVWDKEWFGPGGPVGLRPSYEMVMLSARPLFRIPNRGLPDVWRHKTGSRKPHGHPAEKPLPLVRRLIEVCQLPRGSTVLDPFLGSGTTAVAALEAGMRCIGIEADERWCELAASRIDEADL
jgi:site-specific DNA-methyltransferase (adenine-specific)